jgi:membrane protein implicated in regulation of membrane protease activity
MVGIIAWIGSLILLSRKLNDTPSASMGISIVAIPIFVILLVVFWYVFLGIVRNPDETPGSIASSSPTRSEHQNGDKP